MVHIIYYISCEDNRLLDERGSEVKNALSLDLRKAYGKMPPKTRDHVSFG